MCRFGKVLHDWPESYFKAQQSKGGGLAGVFKQAMDQHQAGKISRSRSILARMFPSSPLARLKSLAVSNALPREVRIWQVYCMYCIACSGLSLHIDLHDPLEMSFKLEFGLFITCKQQPTSIMSCCQNRGYYDNIKSSRVCCFKCMTSVKVVSSAAAQKEACRHHTP